jgi:hypothetical protein
MPPGFSHSSSGQVLQQASVLVATQFSLELRSILRVFSNDVASERTLSPLARDFA